MRLCVEVGAESNSVYRLVTVQESVLESYHD
jgi:hypothetical protein